MRIPLQDSPGIKQGLIRWALRGITFKLFVAAVLMISAGRWDWGMGWLYVAIFLLFDVASAIVALPRNPGLLIERAQPQGETEGWDKIIMPLASGLFPLASWVVAGLNQRFAWLPGVSYSLQVAASAVTILGYGMLVWSMWANAYFSPVARIQSERGHTVATTGPYQWIRHPGYVGAILFSLAVPLMLGSWWALIPGAASAGLYGIRTAYEDRFLQEKLPGYREYAGRVKYRLVPGIW